MRTFVDVFPNTYLWGGPTFPGFYVIGLPDDAPLNLERFRQEGPNRAILADINEWNRFKDTAFFTRLLLATPSELALFSGDAPIITDDQPYTEFPLWRSLWDPVYRMPLDALLFAQLKPRLLGATAGPTAGTKPEPARPAVPSAAATPQPGAAP